MADDLSQSGEPRGGFARKAGAWLVAALVAGGVFAGAATALQGLYARAEALQGPPQRPPLPVEAQRISLASSYAVTDRFAGRIETARETELAFERTGLVLDVAIDEGDRVAKDAVIARIDARSLEAQRDRLKADKSRIETELELAERTRSRQEDLSNKGFASEQRFDEAQANETALKAQIASMEAQIRQLEIDVEKSVLTAPFDGLIAERALDPGAVSQPGLAVARLLETGAPRARIGLPPDRAAELVIGQRYPLELGGAVVEGRLMALRPDLSPSTRTVAALFDLSGVVDLGAGAGPATATMALQGQIVRLARERDVTARGAWLPLSAMQESVKGLWSVYVLTPEPGAFGDGADSAWRVGQEAVTPIHVSGQRVYVGGTLRDGASVILSGVNRVARGQLVRPVFRDSDAPTVDERAALARPSPR